MNNQLELIGSLEDPKFYLESFCKIKTKAKGLAPFILNEAQKDLFNTLTYANRIIILKSRQIGFSTAATGWLYHKTIMTPGSTTALVGYNSDLTSEFLDKVKTFYRTTPEEFRPTIHYNSKFEVSFPKIDSKILVLPSTETVGRGYTIHNCLISELAFFDKADEKMTAIENSVPIDGKIIIESTPNGQSNKYHQMWVQDDNGYEKKEYGWWWHYSEEDIDLIRKRMNNPRRFAQEYSLEFLASGRLVFDIDTIKKQRKNILKVGSEIDFNGKKHIVYEKDKLRIYKPPEPDHNYVCGVDVSEGVDGGDYSVAIIFDRKTGEEVAFYRGHVSPDRLSVFLDKWGRLYNNALMAVEINNHGLTTVTVLKQLMYPCLYFRQSKYDSMGSSWTEKIGWRTTKITRPLLIDDFGQALRDDNLILHSKEMIEELSTFVYNDNNDAVAQSGLHDDTIFAAGIAFQGFKVMYSGKLEQVNYNEHMPSSSPY